MIRIDEKDWYQDFINDDALLTEIEEYEHEISELRTNRHLSMKEKEDKISELQLKINILKSKLRMIGVKK